MGKGKVSGRRVSEAASSPTVTAILGRDIRVVGEQRFDFSDYGLALNKWAGGKRESMDEIRARLPAALLSDKRERPIALFDLMCGTGGFALNSPKPDRLVLNDINSALVNALRVLRDQPNAFISKFADLQEGYHSQVDGKGDDWREAMNDYYLAVREYQVAYASTFGKHSEFDVKAGSDRAIHDAVVFKFLILNSFNGLCRFNPKGEFNAPIGQEKGAKKPRILDVAREVAMLRAVSQKLQGSIITNFEFDSADMLAVIDEAKKSGYRCVAYFDPPYIPVKPDSFVAYAKEPFNLDRQADLRKFMEVLDRRGVSWLLSQSDCAESRKLFGEEAWESLNEGFVGAMSKLPSKRIKVGLTNSRRQINSNGKGRGQVTELLITNYGK